MNADAHDLGGPLSRRDWLLRGGAGFGAVALSGLLAKDNALGQATISASTTSRKQELRINMSNITQ